MATMGSNAVAEAKNVFDHNHPDLDWYSIETEHFVVHYPQSHKKENNKHYLTAKWTAQRAAKVSEEMFPRMCAEFNYYLKEKVHIVILNQGDDLEGFTVPQWDWIEISANPGADFYRWRSRMDWLPDVLVHEFAHDFGPDGAKSHVDAIHELSEAVINQLRKAAQPSAECRARTPDRGPVRRGARFPLRVHPHNGPSEDR